MEVVSDFGYVGDYISLLRFFGELDEILKVYEVLQ